MRPRIPRLSAIATAFALLLCCACSGCLLLGDPDRDSDRPSLHDRDRDGFFNRNNRDRDFDNGADPNSFDCPADGSDCDSGNCPYNKGAIGGETTNASDRSAAALVARYSVQCLGTCHVDIDKQAATSPVDHSKLNEVKTGAFCCMRCKQATVGDGWHNLVSEEGDSALFLCESCWSRTSPAERVGFLNVYLQKTNYSGSPMGERLKSALQ